MSASSGGKFPLNLRRHAAILPSRPSAEEDNPVYADSEDQSEEEQNARNPMIGNFIDIDSAEKQKNQKPLLTAEQESVADGFAAAVNLRVHANKFANVVRSKRKVGIRKDGQGTVDINTSRYIPISGYVKLNELGICELGSDLEDEVLPLDNKASKEKRASARKHNTQVTQSQALLHYFAKLARSEELDEEMDIEFVDGLIRAGADVNTKDVFGQTLLHEVARAWDVSVASYLVEMGAEVNAQDYLGRTPLHVAAAVNYPEMIEMLHSKGGDIESKTFEEGQTPLFFAARNDATNALLRLIKMRAEIEARDYKNRTPLHVAAELDRSETAKHLLEFGADAGVVDTSGMSAIVLMVRKMSPVAKEALDQFHKKDRANRTQLYYLNKLEHVRAGQEEIAAQGVLQVVVDQQKLDLIVHPVFEKLIEIKWNKFGRRGALWQLFINAMFVLSWTIQALAEPSGKPYEYNLPRDIWRIALYGVSVALWLYQIVNEILELYDSRTTYSRWYNWRRGELEKDFKYVHQRWPDEERYLRQELQGLKDQEPSYFHDFWNTFDWVTYVILLVQLVMHVVDVIHHNQTLTSIQRGTFAIAIVFVWIRLMKNFRAFRQVGPFIVICTYMIKDIFRWLFLYLHFYIPYTVAFYMIFSNLDEDEEKVEGYRNLNEVMYSMFRMTLVDDYNYEGLSGSSLYMAQILAGTFLFISAIVMLNLFIALMSDTFQRVYDNAQANALLQQASFIQSEEEGLRQKQLDEFREFIHSKCAPLRDYYDDDDMEDEDDLKKATIQIKESLDEYIENFNEERDNRILMSEMDELHHDFLPVVSAVKKSVKKLGNKAVREIDSLRDEVAELKAMVQLLVDAQVPGGAPRGSNLPRGSLRPLQRRPRRDGNDDDSEDERKKKQPVTPKDKVVGLRRKDSRQIQRTPSGRDLEASSRPVEEPDTLAEEPDDEASPVEDQLVSARPGPPPDYAPREPDPVSAPRRPRNYVRQIQVTPGEEPVLPSVFDPGNSSDDSPRVAVRTRMPPSYNSRENNHTPSA